MLLFCFVFVFVFFWFVLFCFLFPCFVRVCISLALFNSCGFEQAYRLVYFYLLLIYSRHRSFTFFLLFVFILFVFRRFIFQTRRPIIYLAICLSLVFATYRRPLWGFYDSSFSFFLITHVDLYISLVFCFCFCFFYLFTYFLFFIYFSLLYLSICRFHGSCYFMLACYGCLSYLVQNRHSCIFFSMRTFAYLFTFSFHVIPMQGVIFIFYSIHTVSMVYFFLSFFLFFFLFLFSFLFLSFF